MSNLIEIPEVTRPLADALLSVNNLVLAVSTDSRLMFFRWCKILRVTSEELERLAKLALDEDVT